MIDLHTHTTFSDGSLTPEELILEAKSLGITSLAITDHDTLSGLEEGVKMAQKHGMRLIPGVEIEIYYPYSGEFHLLGLDLKTFTGVLNDKLEELRAFRTIRNHKIIEKLNRDGINITYSDVEQLAGGDIVARPHFAQALVNYGIAKDKSDAFENYLNSSAPYYVKKKTLNLKEAIDLIHKDGGKAIIAHPQSLYLSWSKTREVFSEFKKLGLDGIEAWHGGNNKRDCSKFEKIASDLRLIVTGGSDYHGVNIEGRSLGYGAGERKIPEIFLQNFN